MVLDLYSRLLVLDPLPIQTSPRLHRVEPPTITVPGVPPLEMVRFLVLPVDVSMMAHRLQLIGLISHSFSLALQEITWVHHILIHFFMN